MTWSVIYWQIMIFLLPSHALWESQHAGWFVFSKGSWEQNRFDNIVLTIKFSFSWYLTFGLFVGDKNQEPEKPVRSDGCMNEFPLPMAHTLMPFTPLLYLAKQILKI